jgi:hypothetical protein
LLDPRTNEQFEILARVLLRCGLFAYLLLLLTVAVYVLAPEVLYKLNGDLFGLSKHELQLIIYDCIVVTKLVAILLFLIPWLAIRLVLRKASR